MTIVLHGSFADLGRRADPGHGRFVLSALRAFERVQIEARLFGFDAHKQRPRAALRARRPDKRIRCRCCRLILRHDRKLPTQSSSPW